MLMVCAIAPGRNADLQSDSNTSLIYVQHSPFNIRFLPNSVIPHSYDCSYGIGGVAQIRPLKLFDRRVLHIWTCNSKTTKMAQDLLFHALGVLLGRSSALLGLDYGLLGRSWGLFGRSWGSLGSFLGALGVLFGVLGSLLGAPGILKAGLSSFGWDLGPQASRLTPESQIQKTLT